MENNSSKTVIPTSQTADVLRVSGLGVSAMTERGRVKIIDDVSFSLKPGRIIGLAGESGSGKTVTALSLMQLIGGTGLRIDDGEVDLLNTALLGLSERELRRRRGSEISMIFQEPMSSLDPAFRVGSLLSETLRSHKSISKKDARTRSIDLLKRVGIPAPERRIDSYPFEMSGGMLQRVLIAMAIACEPAVLIADEPTTALDVTVQAQILDLIRSLADEGMAVLLVTHDLGLLSEYADDLIIMYAGQIIETGRTIELLTRPKHPYTAGLLASVPSVITRAERLSSIPGRVPAPHLMPNGCRFGPRCGFHQQACDQKIDLDLVTADRTIRCLRWPELALRGVSG